MTATPAYCPVCGQPSPGGVTHASHNVAPTSAGTPPAPTQPTPIVPAKKKSSPKLGCLIVVVVVVALAAIGGNKGTTGGGSGSGSGGGSLTGSYLGWVPVDDGHGYVLFSVRNSGSGSATATCSVSVKDDFGDFGFDSMVGEVVGPGSTISGKMALSVGKGSFLITGGEVTNC